MKRSEINAILREGKDFIASQGFHLPPFAFWTPEDWKHKGHECDEIRKNMLGWDVTDFARGDFERFGLLLFTLRNGNYNDPNDPKPYAEKIMVARPRQMTPMHFHWKKIEDIIVRGGGNLVVKLFNSTKDEQIDRETPVTVSLDGVVKEFPPGAEVVLEPGESITLVQGLYHSFWAEPGKGPVLIGEVSAVNDDNVDNRFAEPLPRFPEIEEDEPPLHYLCNEYPDAQ